MQNDDHSLSEAVKFEAETKGLAKHYISHVNRFQGMGITGRINNENFAIGNMKLMKEIDIVVGVLLREKIKLENQGKTVLVLAKTSAIKKKYEKNPGEVIGLMIFNCFPQADYSQMNEKFIKQEINLTYLSGEEKSTLLSRLKNITENRIISNMAELEKKKYIENKAEKQKNKIFIQVSRKFIFEPDQTQEGQYDITFIVSDGELKDEEAIVITVTNLGDSKSIDDSDNDGILDTQDKCPNTPANIKTHVNKFGCPKPVHTNFDTGTDLDDVDPTASITGLELGVSNKGKIKFLEDVTLNTSSYITKRVNLDNLIKIEKNKVTIDSDSAPQLNRRATIELEGVEFDTPVIKKDGNVILCPFRVDASGDEDCIIESYDKSTGLLVFTVSGFSTYEIQEGSGENETTVSEVKPTSSVNTDKRTSSGGRGGSSSKDSGEKEVTLINFLKILLFFGLISQDQVNFITSLFI